MALSASQGTPRRTHLKTNGEKLWIAERELQKVRRRMTTIAVRLRRNAHEVLRSKAPDDLVYIGDTQGYVKDGIIIKEDILVLRLMNHLCFDLNFALDLWEEDSMKEYRLEKDPLRS